MADLSEVGAEWAESAAADLSGLTGKEVSITGPTVTDAPLDRLLGQRGTIVHTRCSTQDDARAELCFTAPLRAACALVAVHLGRSPDDLEALEQGAFEGEVLTAYADVMDLCAGILGRVLAEEAELPGVQRGDSAALELPLGDTAPLAKGLYRCARFELCIEGFPKETIDILFPDALASSWFGPGSAPGEVEEESGPLAVVDIVPAERDEMDQLARELGRRVWTVDPAELGQETMEDLADCDAVILCWDLGGYGGLDVLEWLRRDDRTRELKVAVASAEPTRSMVIAALRWGAYTVIHKPLEPQEIQTRLLAEP